jgi:hypothetical protein
MNMTMDLFLSIFAGIQVVIGLGILCLLVFEPTDQYGVLGKLGLFFIAAGLIGRAIVSVSEVVYDIPILPYIWALKDLGIVMFVVSLIFRWIDNTRFGRDRRNYK